MDVADPVARLRAAAGRPGPPTSDYDLNPARPAPRPLREAAVLIAAEERGGEPVVWLTKRSSALRHHPGQVALPGGRVDPGDGSAEAAALREAEEEIGLRGRDVELLGTMSAHETVTGFRITPVLARVLRPFDVRPEAGEVEEVFTVPLRYLCDPASYAVRSRLWRGAPRRYYAVPWGPHYVWGATARILRALADRMA